LDSAEIPTLKELFRDKDIGCAAVDCLGETYVIHSEIYGKVDKEKLKQVMEINLLIDEGFRSRGVEKLTTFAITDEQYRYNMFLGYKPTGKEVEIKDCPVPVYEFEKVL
jgi:hypothetical protein